MFALGESRMGYRKALSLGSNPEMLFTVLFYMVLDAFALTMLVFFRQRFGERFLTPVHYIAGIVLAGSLAFGAAMADTGAGAARIVQHATSGQANQPAHGQRAAGMEDEDTPQASATAAPEKTLRERLADSVGASAIAGYFLAAFAAVGALRMLGIVLRRWRDAPPVHSMSMGEPYLHAVLRLPYWLAVIVAEPLLVCLFGALLAALVAPVTGLYFNVLAVFLHLSAMHQWRLHRDALLDDQDQRIEAEAYSGQAKHLARHGKPARKPGGHFFPMVLPRKQTDQLAMLRRFAAQYRDEPAPLQTTPPPTPDAVAEEEPEQKAG